MKNLYKKLRNSLCLLTLLLSFVVEAKDVATISKVKGRAFFLKGSNIWEAKTGDAVVDLMEMTTEEGSQINLVDQFGNKIYLSGSAHIKFLNRGIELKRGYIWGQNADSENMVNVYTANSHTSIKAGEGIVSYDSVGGKTQTMAISGEIQFGNLINADLKIDLAPGEFSFITTDYDNGSPRKSTPVGYASFQKVVSLFDGVSVNSKKTNSPDTKLAAPARGIASSEVFELSELNEEKTVEKTKTVEEEVKTEAATPVVETAKTSAMPEMAQEKVSKGKVIIYKEDASNKELGTSMKPEVKVDELLAAKVKVVEAAKKRKDFRDYSKKSDVPVTVFGLTKVESSTTSQRAPASVIVEEKSNKVMSKVVTPQNYRAPAETMKPQLSPFEKSLLEEYKYQLRHSNEVNELINKLKSYDQDFDKSY